jgi:ACS family sodium-dependent inorganic phosphate cotransporter
MASVAGPTADRMIGSGMAVTRVRKTMQAVAFMGPALAMGTAAYVEEPVATVGLLTLGLSLGAFSYAGLYSNHQDLSPKYASILLGMTNTCGALPGVIGVPLTGYLLKETENWELSMFFPAMFFYVTGTIVFAKYGSGDRQPFTGQPMPIEGEIVDRSGGGGH